MHVRIFLAIAAGKLIAYLSQKFKIGAGSAAPGLYALYIEPNLVSKLSAKIKRNVVITGTNGKTTTSRMLAHFAKSTGLKIIRNHTGSNLERGIASALIPNYQLPDLGIWELDEAAFNTVAPKLRPNIIVFLNVFRDQLDRYGEVDTVVKKWAETLKKIPKETIVLINGDDANCQKLNSFGGVVYQFGVKDYKILGESIEHLKEKDNLDFEAKNVKLNGLSGSSFLVHFHNQTSIVKLPIPGIYHIYDFLAAFAAGINLGLDSKKMIASLNSFTPPFGRVEKLGFGYIFLIKNPAGATQVFQTIAPQLNSNDRLLLVLNDNVADGRDVSWIWDADFEVLQNSPRTKPGDLKIYISGTRADDLANRLKYAGFNPRNLIIQPSLTKALQQARKGLKGRLFILPTYTAMLELQNILTKIGIKKHYWKEEN